jgi:response regulator RpfG family c-di-GMP phosphodiesterase
MVIIVPSYNRVKGLLGFETVENVKMALVQEQKNTDTAVEANTTLKETLNDVVVAQEDVLATIDRLNDTVKETKVTVDKITEVRDTEIKRIVKAKTKNQAQRKLAETEKDKALNAEEIREISVANITAIWSTYCYFNENDNCYPES